MKQIPDWRKLSKIKYKMRKSSKKTTKTEDLANNIRQLPVDLVRKITSMSKSLEVMLRLLNAPSDILQTIPENAKPPALCLKIENNKFITSIEKYSPLTNTNRFAGLVANEPKEKMMPFRVSGNLIFGSGRRSNGTAPMQYLNFPSENLEVFNLLKTFLTETFNQEPIVHACFHCMRENRQLIEAFTPTNIELNTITFKGTATSHQFMAKILRAYDGTVKVLYVASKRLVSYLEPISQWKTDIVYVSGNPYFQLDYLITNVEYKILIITKTLDSEAKFIMLRLVSLFKEHPRRAPMLVIFKQKKRSADDWQEDFSMFQRFNGNRPAVFEVPEEYHDKIPKKFQKIDLSHGVDFQRRGQRCTMDLSGHHRIFAKWP